MKFAWIENDRIRDICPGDPASHYHPDVAVFYDTLVPDDAANGDGWVNNQLVKPAPPAPPAPVPPPPRTWTVSDVRPNLTLAERVKWDGDKSDFIKTAKIELAQPRNLADTTEVLEMLVDAGDISQASMNKILA
jgi:hypothetical protein